MKTALIISLNFHPGHVSHMVASYKQFEEIGYKSIYYVNPEFRNYLPHESDIVDSNIEIPKCDVAIFLFPSIHNLRLIKKIKKQGTKILYIFHEPLAPLKQYRQSGFSYKYLAKLWIIDHVSALTVKWSDVILLPSKKAVDFYHANSLYKNKSVHYLPLMYDDEAQDMLSVPKKFISYIGTVAADHSFNEFLAFVETALANDWYKDKMFLIATKSEFDIPLALKSSPRLIVQKGRPLTDAEINEAYAASAVVWNAYIRTTQSGVLAKSYMFGTPAIVLRHNLNEFMQPGKTVAVVDDNSDVYQIKSAIDAILNSQQYFTSNCRDLFLNTFYYKEYNSAVMSIIDK